MHYVFLRARVACSADCLVFSGQDDEELMNVLRGSKSGRLYFPIQGCDEGSWGCFGERVVLETRVIVWKG